MAPSPAKGADQDRGNSGVFLMGTLRGPGPRLLREQDLRRRHDRGHLRPVPAARQRLPHARANGRPTTSSSAGPASTRTAKLLTPGPHDRLPQRRPRPRQRRA
ncbi:MAG: hypothetical protein MZV64_33990 [Ignavibacteriales bacterium]|nr:hypothetical protein [Ignavibacteriales bacterium]